MARSLRDAKIGSREARSRLKVRGKPYWREIEPGLHLGYRRLGGKPGTWTVRRYAGKQTYSLEAIKGVVADDYSDADGTTVLSWDQAQREVLKRKPQAGPYTVGDAIKDYLDHIEHKAGHYDARLHVNVHILPELGEIKLGELTASRLEKWLKGLAIQSARKRAPKGEPQRYYEVDNSPEGRRRRQATANRVWTTLRAALNHAWRAGHVADDPWRRVKGFQGATAARIRFLTVDEARRLVNACDANFRPLVEAGLTTGCRYSELARLVASDFNADASVLHIRLSKSGRPRVVVLGREGTALFRRLCAGRASDELLFRLPGGTPWSRGNQSRPMREACRGARIKSAGFHTLRHTWASLAIMSGMPVAVISKNLGHTSTKMVEQHYGHLRPDFIAEQIQQHAPTFGFKIDSKVAALR
jgi:integrase